MYTVPNGMTIKDFGRHPVRQLIRQAGYAGKRGLPSRAELDSLELSPAVRARVVEACRDAAAIHDDGLQRDAWEFSDEAAAEIIGSLSDDQRDPDWFTKPDDVTDPAALARLVKGC